MDVSFIPAGHAAESVSVHTLTVARPAFVPTEQQRELVTTAARVRVDHRVIARQVGISRTTLTKYFDQELAAAAAKAHLEVIEAMYRRAIAGSVSAARFYLYGWRGRRRPNSTGGIFR